MDVTNPPVLARVEAFFHSAKRRGSGWDKWEVLSMKVREELGSPYSGSVEIATEDLKVDFSKLVGMSCALELRRAGINRRYFKGIVYRVERLADQFDHAIARVDFAAALWGLRYGRDTRIFENETAPKIIEEVLRTGLRQFRREARFNLTRTYRKREYCVQWQESDLAFVQRLMVLEGIFCYFEQGKGLDETETVVFVDNNRSLPWIETMPAPVKVDPTRVRATLTVPVERPWLELRYLDKNGQGISKASYLVESPRGQVLAKGQLDENGHARVSGLPAGTKNVCYSFFDDPAPYEPEVKPIGNPEASYVAGWIDEGLAGVGRKFDGAADWTWKVLQGDFNDDPTTAQTLAGTALTLIPIVDQVGDARDLIADVFKLVEYYSPDGAGPLACFDPGEVLKMCVEASAELPPEEHREFWLWVALVLTAIGCFPELGSAIKGVFKTLLKALRETAGKIAPRRLLGMLVEAANYFGKGKGNAFRWLKSLRQRFDELGKFAAELLEKILKLIERALEVVPSRAADARNRALQAVRRMRERLHEMLRQVLEWLEEKLSRAINSEHIEKTDARTETKQVKQQKAMAPGALPRAPEAEPKPQQPAGIAAHPKNARTAPSRAPDATARPGGTPTAIPEKIDADGRRALERENESAQALAKKGYVVEQNPALPGAKAPDYLIEGKVFDNYAPKTANARNIWDTVEGKVATGQTSRIVLNTSDSVVDLAILRKQIDENAIAGLEEILVVLKDGSIIPFWP